MHGTNTGSNLQTRDIGIAGMSCENCAKAIERALKNQEGITEVRVDRMAGIARVTFDPAITNIPQMHDLILKAGYHPTTRIPPAPQRAA